MKNSNVKEKFTKQHLCNMQRDTKCQKYNDHCNILKVKQISNQKLSFYVSLIKIRICIIIRTILKHINLTGIFKI